ncbi:MAG: D-amino acid aminotransferase [Phycisphaerales bacterium]|nr:MAG: D-amino acid aminotransferase [Phycisphaerales bacterium]
MKVHLNGQLLDAAAARVSPFDRGFVFGDGLYEGLRAFDGVPFAMRLHIERLREGLRETRIEGFDPDSLAARTDELLRANALRDAFVYWQVTRGAPDVARAPTTQWRDRTAASPLAPTVFGYAVPLPGLDACAEPAARRITLRPDLRWLRGHVKSISLMGSVLGAYEALDAGCDDAVYQRDGFVTEGVATNVVVRTGDALVTPGVEGGRLLGGVTRRVLLAADPSIITRPVSVEELHGAQEVMLVGTSTMVAAATHIDGAPVGDATPGEAARGLLRALVAAVRRDIAAAGAPVHSET